MVLTDTISTLFRLWCKIIDNGSREAPGVSERRAALGGGGTPRQWWLPLWGGRGGLPLTACLFQSGWCMQYTFQYHVYYSIKPMFAQHTMDVRSTRTKLDRNRENQSKESRRLHVWRAEKMLPVWAGSEHSQTAVGETQTRLNVGLPFKTVYDRWSTFLQWLLI